MKKYLSILLTVAMLICLVPAAIFATDGVPEWFTEESVEAIISDKNLASAIYDSMTESETFSWDGLTNTTDALQAYTGAVSYSLPSSSKAIKDISGLNKMPNAKFTLIDQRITDVSALDKTLSGIATRNGVFFITGSPIHIWWHDVSDVPRATYAVPTQFNLYGNAAYLKGYGADTKTQTLKYDVYFLTEDTKGTEPGTILTSGQHTPSYTFAGGVFAEKERPESADTTAVFKVSGEGSGEASIYYHVLDYTSGSAHQENNANYIYEITDKYYYMANINGRAAATGGIYLAKYSDTDPDHTTPIAGAVYELYMLVGSEYNKLGEYTTKSEPIAIDGLADGKYYFVEKSAPKGYALSDTKYNFEIKAGAAIGAPKYTITPGLSEITLTKDAATWTPDWTSGFGGAIDNIKIKTTDTQNVTTADVGTDAFLENKNEGSHITINAPAASDYNAAVKFTIGSKTFDSAKDAQDYVNGLIDAGQVTENISISYTADFAQKAAKYETVEAEDHLITIWVENTTGDADSAQAAAGYPVNAGGTVKVEGSAPVGTTADKVSSALDGTDNNNVNRKPTNVVSGKADNGWRVDVNDIKVGLRGATEPGADKIVVDYDLDENGYYHVPIDDKTYLVKIDYDRSSETAKVTIKNMDQDMDVSIPFYRMSSVLPETGEKLNVMPFIGAAVSLIALAYIAISMKKKEEF